MIMSNSQLKKYYFPNKQIENLAKKYFPNLIDFYGDKTLFENKNLLPNERLILEKELTEKMVSFLNENKNIFYDFALTYSINDKEILAEIILQSIMAYSKLNNPKYKTIDIFLDPNSMLYFENLYPATIQRWLEDKNTTILNYVFIMKEIIYFIKDFNFDFFDKN